MDACGPGLEGSWGPVGHGHGKLAFEVPSASPASLSARHNAGTEGISFQLFSIIFKILRLISHRKEMKRDETDVISSPFMAFHLTQPEERRGRGARSSARASSEMQRSAWNKAPGGV